MSAPQENKKSPTKPENPGKLVEKKVIPNTGTFFSCLTYLIGSESSKHRKVLLNQLIEKKSWIEKLPSGEAQEQFAPFVETFYWFKQWVLSSNNVISHMLENVEYPDALVTESLLLMARAFQAADLVTNQMTLKLNEGISLDENGNASQEFINSFTNLWIELHQNSLDLGLAMRTLVDSLQKNPVYSRYLDVWIEMGDIPEQII